MSLIDDFPPDSCDRCTDTLIDPPTDNDSPVAATEVDTDSIPETVIEISSDSSTSDLPNPTAKAPAPGTGFVPPSWQSSDGSRHYWSHLTNFENRVAPLLLDPRLYLSFPTPDNANEIWHGAGIINELLRCGTRAFKIGITYKPYCRWSNRSYGYEATGYSGMVFIYVSESSDDVAEMERALIALYRYRDRLDNVVGRPGNTRCMNRAAGGEGAHHGYSPFFVYIAFKQ